VILFIRGLAACPRAHFLALATASATALATRLPSSNDPPRTAPGGCSIHVGLRSIPPPRFAARQSVCVDLLTGAAVPTVADAATEHPQRDHNA